MPEPEVFDTPEQALGAVTRLCDRTPYSDDSWRLRRTLRSLFAERESYKAEFADQLAKRDARIADYEEAAADKRRNTRLLDVAMSGEDGAAKQASLCDLIPQAQSMRARIAELEVQISRWETEHEDYKLEAAKDAIRFGIENVELKAEIPSLKARIAEQSNAITQGLEREKYYAVCITALNAEIASLKAALAMAPCQRGTFLCGTRDEPLIDWCKPCLCAEETRERR